MKTKILVKPKSKNQYPNIKRVCCALEHINYLIFTNGSKTQTKLGYLSLLDELRLQADSI